MDSESSPIPKKKKRLSVSTEGDGGGSSSQGGGGGLATCGSQPQSSHFNNNNNSNKLAIGQEVIIESRTAPGINKPGGHGTISNIHYDNDNNSKMVDVKYSLGGKEANIELKYVKPHVELPTRRKSRFSMSQDSNNSSQGSAATSAKLSNKATGRQRSTSLSESLAQSTADCLFSEPEDEQQPLTKKKPAPQDDGTKDDLDTPTRAALAVSASMLSLPLTEPLNTPKDDEGDIKLESNLSVASKGGEVKAADSRKRRMSAEEDILLGSSSRNTSTNSLGGGEKKEEEISGMPDTKKIKVDMKMERDGDDSSEASDWSTFRGEEYHQEATSWSVRQNLGVKTVSRGSSGVSITAPLSSASNKNNNTPLSKVNDTPNSTPTTLQKEQGIPQRWRAHQMAEDYISLASSITLPPISKLGPYGYTPTIGQYPIEQVTALGYLTSELRRPTVIEKWNPYEISIFEAALALHGKVFHTISKFVKTKNTKEVIEFYYMWKKTSHGKRWKNSFVPEILESEVDSSDEEEEEEESGKGKGK